MEEANKTAEAIKQLEIKITSKAGAADKLFGSVSNIDIADALLKEGHAIDKKFISIAGGIVKRLGKYDATIRLHRDVTVDITFEVVAES